MHSASRSDPRAVDPTSPAHDSVCACFKNSDIIGIAHFRIRVEGRLARELRQCPRAVLDRYDGHGYLVYSLFLRQQLGIVRIALVFS